jgi:hypothetical protein
MGSLTSFYGGDKEKKGGKGKGGGKDGEDAKDGGAKDGEDAKDAGEKGGDEGEKDAAEVQEKPANVSAKLFRATIYRSEDDKNKQQPQPHPNKPAIPDEAPESPEQTEAFNEAKAGAGEQIMADKPMNDSPRLEAHYGPGKWIKMEYKKRLPPLPNGKKRTIVIHYFKSESSKKCVEFKFKNRGV